MEYIPSQVWSILVADAHYEGDLDERLDVARGLRQLPRQQRVFLQALSQGYTGKEAGIAAGLGSIDHPGRFKRKALKKLTAIINEGVRNEV